MCALPHERMDHEVWGIGLDDLRCEGFAEDMDHVGAEEGGGVGGEEGGAGIAGRYQTVFIVGNIWKRTPRSHPLWRRDLAGLWDIRLG